MRILLAGRHRYPSGGLGGTGLQPNLTATGGSGIVQDLLAKGMAELNGHEVMYHLEQGAEAPLPEGVIPATSLPDGVDLVHFSNAQFIGESPIVSEAQSRGIPWMATCHTGPASRPPEPPANWVFVLRGLGRRYVTNGVDPSELCFSEARGEYFLFLCRLRNLHEKGLDVALMLCRSLGFPLVVAASCKELQLIEECAAACQAAGARFVGDVRGQAKAALLAGAAAVLFPSRFDDACPMVLLEALMSGTPIICSDQPACREICTPEVGFVCREPAGYVRAIHEVTRISRRACRDEALRKYHYHRMARDYLAEFQKELAARF